MRNTPQYGERSADSPFDRSGRPLATEAKVMKKWELDVAEGEQEDCLDSPDPRPRARSRGKMPVGSEARAKAASKTTFRSRRASKRVSRSGSGIRNRRNKRLD